MTPCSPESDQQCQCRQGAFYCDSELCRENCYRCSRCWPRGPGRTGRGGGRGPHTSSQCTLALALGQLRSCLPLTPQFPHLYAGACHPSCPLEVKSSKAPGCLHLAAGLESASQGPWMRGRAVASWEPSVACQGHCTPGPQPCRRQVIDTRIANP